MLVNWAQTAPAALAAWRQRVDPRANALLQQALSAPDRDTASGDSLSEAAPPPFGEAQLLTIVDTMFASSQGDQALDRLAQIALARGDYATARRRWMSVSPVFTTPASLPEELRRELRLPGGLRWSAALRDADLNSLWPRIEPLLREPAAASADSLVYPDTDLELARIWACLALVSILEGETAEASIEIELLKRLHPDARGRLAGREGDYVQTLTGLMAEQRDWPRLPRPNDWRTFGGDTTRNGRGPHSLDVSRARLWSTPLLADSGLAPDDAADWDFDSVRNNLKHYPIAVGDGALLHDGRRLRALDLWNGTALWPVETPAAETPDSFYDSGEAQTVWRTRTGAVQVEPSRTLSSDGRRLYARFGAPQGSREPPGQDSATSLAGFDLATQKLLFRIEPEGPEWSFEGAPAVAGSAIYVGLRRTDQVQPQAFVAAYDALDGALLWRSERLCSADSLHAARSPQLISGLVAYDEGAVYYNTDLGAIAALDAATGQTRWISTYPRISEESAAPAGLTSAPRSPAPALLHRGMLFAAPNDCGRIFALDAGSGRLIWRTAHHQPPDVIHLLGTGANRLIASGDRLYWFDIHSGQPRGQFPGPSLDGPGLARPSPCGFGRGLLAGELVYFPTRDAIYVFQQQTQRTDAGWIPQGVAILELAGQGAQGGNLAIGDGVLLVASPDSLDAYRALPMTSSSEAVDDLSIR